MVVLGFYYRDICSLVLVYEATSDYLGEFALFYRQRLTRYSRKLGISWGMLSEILSAPRTLRTMSNVQGRSR